MALVDQLKTEFGDGEIFVRQEDGTMLKVTRRRIGKDVKAFRRKVLENKRRGTSSEIKARVDECARLMREGKWAAGSTSKRLAADWGVNLHAVSRYAAEAKRIVAWENTDRDTVREVVSNSMATNLVRATAARKFGDAAKVADVWSKIVGAREPEKHEHLHAIERFEQMAPRTKVMWLNERIAQMQAAREELLLQVEEEEEGLRDSKALTVSTG